MYLTSTTEAKKAFSLTSTDIAAIQGIRRRGGGKGSSGTLTLYYHSDLVAASITRWGQEYFNTKVPEGKLMSGVADKEKKAEEEKLAVEHQVADDNARYAIVPPERLMNVKMYNLHEMLTRYDGGLRGKDGTKPYATSKAEVIERLIQAGYSTTTETEFNAKKRVSDDAEWAAREKQRAEQEAKEAIRVEAEKQRALVAKAREEERLALYKSGQLAATDLSFAELLTILKPLGLRCDGGKVRMLERLSDYKSNKLVDDEKSKAKEVVIIEETCVDSVTPAPSKRPIIDDEVKEVHTQAKKQRREEPVRQDATNEFTNAKRSKQEGIKKYFSLCPV